MISPTEYETLFLLGGGLAAGFIDSIAGGAGLVTLPILSLLLSPGAPAIATNKVAAVVAAFVALLVYSRRGHFNWRKSLTFLISVGSGSVIGSLIAPLLPPVFFKWFLLATCPVLLWVVWKKDLWVEQKHHPEIAQIKKKFWKNKNLMKIIISGFFCGVYDGGWGPGSGTFMFLSLLFFSKMPLISALAASKLANTCSAGVALISYATQGWIHWRMGLLLAIGISAGAYTGATLATRSSAKVVRPLLAGVVALLLLRLYYE